MPDRTQARRDGCAHHDPFGQIKDMDATWARVERETIVASYLVVQISDLHLTTSGSLPSGVWPRDNLLSGLRLLEEADIRPKVFLLTGDLADRRPACADNDGEQGN